MKLTHHRSLYPWPASALSASTMSALYRVREKSKPRIPITTLIAQAVAEKYCENKLSSAEAHSSDGTKKESA